jgi:peptidoglycan/xylan/chitin deacetylase (PgdA/CDA1 family)
LRLQRCGFYHYIAHFFFRKPNNAIFEGYKILNMKATNNGIFVISLDFELFWGVWDVTTKDKYGENILGVKHAIPSMLSLFEQYNVKATFATVGFLFAKNKQEMFNHFPEVKPNYSQEKYDVYAKEMELLGNDEIDDGYHFGYSLLEKIKKNNHEIGTHTFSHYYCLEEGQSIEEFDADIKAAIRIAEANEIKISSIVFPRNQINNLYLPVLKENGIHCYRGNPLSWIYKPRKFGSENLFIRMCRLIDAYLPIFGYNIFDIKEQNDLPINIPGSRFFKPYLKGYSFLEKLKLKRILNEMTVAAKKKKLYHLWWHPHNFGINIKENMNNLIVIMEHYKALEKKYGFKNLTMKEAAEL